MKPKRWQDWGLVILGAWMVISPWALDFADQQVAARSAWLLGAAIVVFAGIAVYMPQAWEEAVNILLAFVCWRRHGRSASPISPRRRRTPRWSASWSSHSASGRCCGTRTSANRVSGIKHRARGDVQR